MTMRSVHTKIHICVLFLSVLLLYIVVGIKNIVVSTQYAYKSTINIKHEIKKKYYDGR